MACWWNAYSLLCAVKHPFAPQPFQMCFIISVSIMWLVSSIAVLISHTRVRGEEVLEKAAKAWEVLAFWHPSRTHKASVLKGRCCDVTLQRHTSTAEVIWVTWWEQAVLLANTSLWVAELYKCVLYSTKWSSELLLIIFFCFWHNTWGSVFNCFHGCSFYGLWHIFPSLVLTVTVFKYGRLGAFTWTLIQMAVMERSVFLV